MLLILVHELGHALVLKREGIGAGLPVFIPFMGAVISMRGLPRNAWIEAKVAFGGPLLGTLGSLCVLGMGLYSQEPLFFALAKTGFLINLFNMMPVSPMDGGRILGAVSKWFLIIGLGIGAALNIFYLKSPLLYMMLLLGCLQAWRTFKDPVPGYYEIPTVQRLTTGLAYLALLASLFWALAFTKPFLQDLTPHDDLVFFSGVILFFALSKLFARSLTEDKLCIESPL